MSGWIGTIIIGFVVGVLAKLLHPGRDDLGFIMTTLLGIAGAALAGFVGRSMGWYGSGRIMEWIASTVAAVVILFVYTRFIKRK
ncbi:GlsB/YeaQ/YmgE family stress response membrane protein [Neisseria sp.]|uniref:GlsB/YeaQ/YmgE family stress response membrane protein n=1 Tax=Neisseria sp. TaxID=192066 RepID=UPI0035A185BF